jgi:hypothetical protein
MISMLSTTAGFMAQAAQGSFGVALHPAAAAAADGMGPNINQSQGPWSGAGFTWQMNGTPAAAAAGEAGRQLAGSWQATAELHS